VYAKLSAVGAPPSEQRVGLVVDGNALQFGRAVWLRQGWPDLWQRLVTELPRLKEMS
jgi:phosphoadenosine phosphosulfate reductase